MVEVFKTDVRDQRQAAEVLEILSLHFPDHKLNFDLDDCDKVLRVEGACQIADHVRAIARDCGFVCDVLD
jgi:hypothetical protein